jgi:D-glycero-alpha-D-manno-heptose-7-phosphate kinase
VIITRTPLRISLGGGGTDLPSYYCDHGGFVVSAAISKYVYITVNRSFLPGYFLKYSGIEHSCDVASIKHPLIREVLAKYEVPAPLEIVSVADVPAGTGLGSSGSFLVGLIHGVLAHKRMMIDAELLASAAVQIEMVNLQEPVGKQDQYIAAYGGLLCQEYKQDGSVKVYPLQMTDIAVRELRESLMLFFIGSTRSASAILQDQKQRSESGDKSMIGDLHFTKDLGYEVRRVLEAGDVLRFGDLMHQHWLRKRGRSAGMTNNHIDDLYDLALSKGGATGGKLVGAGGSGFMLFHTRDRTRLRRTMHEAGLAEMDFTFDFDGSVVTLRNHA